MKLKIVIYSPIAHDGTSFYRGYGPFKHLAKRFPVEIVEAKEGYEYNWNTLQDVDIVFLQRPSTSVCLEIIKTAKRCRKPIWIDYDDDYINIPESNPRHELYSNTVRQSITRECMSLADIITVSTLPIKMSILKNVNPDADIRVIKNAYNEEMFSIPNTLEDKKKIFNRRDKLVLWRGGDTHVKDVETYREAIEYCFTKYPDYKWCFYGHQFSWITELVVKHDWHERVLYYEFQDIMQYYNNIMQLRPDIMIVPLEDIYFNHAKSNISWIEGTLAGATVMASGLNEFKSADECMLFYDNDGFSSCFETLIKNREFSFSMYEKSCRNIPLLTDTNVKRVEVARDLVALDKRFTPEFVKEDPWGDRRFFEYALVSGFIQENEGYKKGHHDVADWLINELKPETMIEIGPGPGAMLERFLFNNVQSIGIELNDYFIDYFRERNPVLAERIIKYDITQLLSDDTDTIEPTDLGICIEVFEHISLSEEQWDKLITKLSMKFKYFFFSSTPYRASIRFDQRWGHINVRPSESWIDLFTRNGFVYLSNPQKICKWDMLFKSDYEEKIGKIKPSFINPDASKVVIK